MKEKKGNKKRKLVSLKIDAKYYKIFHKAIESIVDECRFKFDGAGLTATVDSPCNSMLCMHAIDKGVFNEYALTEPVEVGFDLMKAEDIGLIEDYNTGVVSIEIFEVKKKKTGVKYLCEIHHDIFKNSFYLIDSNSIKRKSRIPRLTLNCCFGIVKETLYKIAIRDEALGVVFENGGVVFSDTWNEEPTWFTDSMIVSSTESGKAMYTSDNMLDIVKTFPDDSIIDFKFSSDYPCKLSCDIVDGFKIEWMLAPRLRSD